MAIGDGSGASGGVLPIGAVDLTETALGLPVRIAPNYSWRCTFAAAVAAGIDTNYFSQIGSTGSGQGISQTGGNLVLTTGTTANAETVIRSIISVQNAFSLKWGLTASQRIANQNLIIEMVDLVGDGLALTVNSATSVTVTIPSNPFAAANVGQSINLHSISGVTAPAQRATIASVSGNNVTFTVAGFPASGSGTCSLTGWNYHQVIYNGTTATTNTYDAQRRGYNSGATTTNENTTASPGHMGQIYSGTDTSLYSDGLAASDTALSTKFVQRASRVLNIPSDDVPLYLQIRNLNGTTAPASTTTWTIAAVALDSYPRQPVQLVNSPSLGAGSAASVMVQNTPTVTVGSGTVTTVTTVATTNSVTQSGVALPVESNPVASAAIITTTTTTLAPTNGGALVFQLNVTAVSGTNPTMDVTIQESLDNGTTYARVLYQFPRVTSLLSTPFFSPPIVVTGSKIEIVQTITGSSPSFTRAIFMDQVQVPIPRIVRQIFDRTVTLTTLSSVTAALSSENTGSNVQMDINIGAVTTTAPALQLQGSDDGGFTYYNIGSPLTAVASSTVSVTVANVSAGYVRAIVTTAGSGVTAGYVLLRTF